MFLVESFSPLRKNTWRPSVELAITPRMQFYNECGNETLFLFRDLPGGHHVAFCRLPPALRRAAPK